MYLRFLIFVFLYLGILSGLGADCSQSTDPAPDRFTFESPQMGVPFRLILYSSRGEPFAERAAEAVWNRISALNEVLSNYETDSELSRLGYASGQGQWMVVSDDLWTVITEAQRLAVQSGGAFDFTLGPATALWRKVRREKELPNAAVLASMMSKTGWRNLVLSPEDQSVCLTASGMRLDPGGIAKGYALDEGLKVLETFGITRALISGGGDMAVLDPPPESNGWRVRLANFQQGSEESEMISLEQSAIATSGDLYQFVEINGTRYSHILNPKTGLGLTQRILVSVIASTGMEADSLATTLSVLGPLEAPKWISLNAPTAQVRMLWLDSHEVVHQWETDSFGR